MKKKLLIGLLVLAVGTTHGNTYDISKANKLYQKHQFDEALSQYEKAMTEVKMSPDLFYNAGTTAMRAQKYDKAMLYLEKALKFDPGMVDAQINREITIDKIGNNYIPDHQSTFGKLWKKIQYALTSNQWMLMFGIFSILMVFLWSQKDKFKNQKLYQGLFSLSLVLNVIALSACLANFTLTKSNTSAIISKSNPTIYEAPGAEAKSLNVPAGQKCKIISEKKELDLIRLPNGVECYVNKDILRQI